MERRATTSEEMAEELEEGKRENRLTKGQYNEISAKLKEASLIKDIQAQSSILKTVCERGKVDLNNLEEVRAQTIAYFEACTIAVVPPLFMQLCTSFGLSRQYVYSYMRTHPSSPTTHFLATVQTSISSIIASQSLQRNYSEAVSIFLLKNSGTGLQDRAEERELEEERDEMNSEEIARKYSFLEEDI